jgi:hypothetical protein
LAWVELIRFVGFLFVLLSLYMGFKVLWAIEGQFAEFACEDVYDWDFSGLFSCFGLIIL